MYIQMAVVSLVVIVAKPTFSETESGYSCTNSDFEISCNSQRCEVTFDEGFIPMDVLVSNRRLEVCADSGCWIGRPSLLSEDDINLVAQGDLFRQDASTEPKTRMNVVLDKDIGVGVLSGAGFFHPMQCRPWKCEGNCKAKQD